MVWAILVLLGVPIWLCALGILVLVLRNRALRERPGNMSVRVRRPGRQRWTRANGLWVSDVFVWRASPAAWAEDVRQIAAVSRRTATTEDRNKLHRLGDDVALVTMTTGEGDVFDVATAADARDGLFGPHFHDRESDAVID